jgi:hypothetical protein
MRVLPPRVPPELTITVGWRELWLDGCFVQQRLINQSGFSSATKERLPPLGVNPESLEQLDEAGAVQPIAFAAGGEPPDLMDLSTYEENMSFREEHQYADWSTYAWDAHGHPHTTALYSPWQVLYVDDALDRSNESLPLSVLLGPAEQLNETLEKVRGFLEALDGSWRGLHESWSALLKLLVRVQNRYLPEVTNSVNLPFDAELGERVNPYRREVEAFDAQTVVNELGVDHEQILNAYWFLVERGIDREPRDGMERLRRARPRSAYKNWRGPVRRAHDHYQAAEILRLLLTTLTGEPPGRPPGWLMDGRQLFRGALFDQGPVPRLSRSERQEELIATALYPHAVHVVGEGKSEQDFITTLVEGILGEQAAQEIGFTDLGGSGSASRLTTMVDGFTTYAQRTLVIVDTEGEMERYVVGLERSGKLASEDILRFTRNIEDDSFDTSEQIDVLVKLAGDPRDERPAVKLTITEAQLEQAFNERRIRANADPGRVGVLLGLAEDPANGGPARVGKPELACAFAERMLEELDGAQGDQQVTDALYERRRLLKFTLERVIPPLMNRRW